MGLFKKKNKKTKYVDYQYSKNGKNAPTITAFDNMHYFLVKDSSDDQLQEMCDVCYKCILQILFVIILLKR